MILRLFAKGFVVAIAVFLMIFAAIFAAETDLFHTEPRQVYWITHVKQKPYSSTLAVAVASFKQSDPKGIATFPDGGYPLFNDRKAVLYLVDLEYKTVSAAGEISVPSALISNPKPHISGWNGNKFYVLLAGQTGTDSVETTGYYYAVHLNGRIEAVSHLPQNLWVGWGGGLVNAEKSLELSSDWSEITVTDAVRVRLIGTKIVLSKQGSLDLVSPP